MNRIFHQVGEVVNTLCGYKTLNQQVRRISDMHSKRNWFAFIVKKKM